MNFAVNKKARFEYEILETFEAGLVLTGAEVKAIRQGRINIAEAYVRPRNGELLLIGAHVSEYKEKGYAQQDPLRDKKILMHRHEIERLSSKVAEKGLALVPLAVYPSRQYIKLKIGIGKGKKTHDKRDSLMKKAVERDMERRFKIK
ncbi:MAG: SsrA-binding protein SmpB [Oligoflexia bacterium]|nr:SsrA-binding protein SmpB [Oligoflexia bacterium]